MDLFRGQFNINIPERDVEGRRIPPTTHMHLTQSWKPDPAGTSSHTSQECTSSELRWWQVKASSPRDLYLNFQFSTVVGGVVTAVNEETKRDSASSQRATRTKQQDKGEDGDGKNPYTNEPGGAAKTNKRHHPDLPCDENETDYPTELSTTPKLSLLVFDALPPLPFQSIARYMTTNYKTSDGKHCMRCLRLYP